MLQTAFNALALGSVYALMAVGIGLVFGVLRLVNFAYGQLIMAGAYTLAIGSEHGWPEWASVLACFGVVIGLSLLMEVGLFRPLRGTSPATMLVATFAVAFLLQSIALLKFGPLVKTASIFPGLFDPVGHGQFVTVRKITIVAIVAALVALAALTFLLAKTTIGLHMRAASADFRTARLLGVRANATRSSSSSGSSSGVSTACGRRPWVDLRSAWRLRCSRTSCPPPTASTSTPSSSGS
jgi:branched-chain amino acid transport system permease protein